MGRYLEQTIESVLQNLRPNDEYYIIDGGSTDESIKIIKSFEKQITGWISEPDDGYADALAKGFAMSNNTYQCWINSGDLLLPGALDLARDLLISTGADLIYGDDLYIDEENRVIAHSSGYASSLRNMMLYGGWTPLQDACYWKKQLYDDVGGINTELKYAADYELFLSMSCVGKSQYVPVIFSAFRQHENQKSRQGANMYRIEREAARFAKLRVLGKKGLKLHLYSLWYHIYIRWRVHIGNHLHRQRVKSGVDVSTIRAQNYLVKDG